MSAQGVGFALARQLVLGLQPALGVEPLQPGAGAHRQHQHAAIGQGQQAMGAARQAVLPQRAQAAAAGAAFELQRAHVLRAVGLGPGQGQAGFRGQGLTGSRRRAHPGRQRGAGGALQQVAAA